MSERESAPEPDAKPAAKAEPALAAKATNWSRIRQLLMEAEQIAQGRTLTPTEAMEIVQAARNEGIPMAELIEFVNQNATAATAARIRQVAENG